MTVAEIAALVGGELIGDPAVQIDSGQTLESAASNQLAFWKRTHPSDRLPPTKAGCVIVDTATKPDGQAVVRVRQPRRAFAQVLRSMLADGLRGQEIEGKRSADPDRLERQGVLLGMHAVVEPGARIGSGTVIAAQAFVGAEAVLGRDCRVMPGARILGRSRLGDRVVLHCGAVIGSDGFGLVFEDDHYEKFPQIGGVEIGDDVEVGANSCVDRGALGDTRIGAGTKLDNLVHIGHNCNIGRHVVMAAQVGLSGGVVVEDYAVLGGQVGIGDRARVGARAQLGGQGGLLPDKRLAGGKAYWGTPARPLRDELGRQAQLSRLPRMAEEIKRLSSRIEELEATCERL